MYLYLCVCESVGRFLENTLSSIRHQSTGSLLGSRAEHQTDRLWADRTPAGPAHHAVSQLAHACVILSVYAVLGTSWQPLLETHRTLFSHCLCPWHRRCLSRCLCLLSVASLIARIACARAADLRLTRRRSSSRETLTLARRCVFA